MTLLDLLNVGSRVIDPEFDSSHDFGFGSVFDSISGSGSGSNPNSASGSSSSILELAVNPLATSFSEIYSNSTVSDICLLVLVSSTSSLSFYITFSLNVTFFFLKKKNFL